MAIVVKYDPTAMVGVAQWQSIGLWSRGLWVRIPSLTHDMELRPLIKLALAFFLCSILLVSMLFVRAIYGHSIVFLFLFWNLILAWIPFLLAITFSRIDYRPSLSRLVRFIKIALTIAWLVTLPNAMYIITDIMHIQYLGGRDAVPLWFDSLIVTAFGFTGLLLGFSSLHIYKHAFEKYMRPAFQWCLMFAIIIASSFGIYLGRFLRWNSWDIMRSPAGLFRDIADRVINPSDHPRTILFTLSYAVCLSLIFVIFQMIIGLTNKTSETGATHAKVGVN